MDVVTFTSNDYQRTVSKQKLLAASSLFNQSVENLDGSEYSPQILDAVLDLVEGNYPSNQLTSEEFKMLVNTLTSLQMDQFIPPILENFRQLVSEFGQNDFLEIIYMLLNLDLNPNLTQDDLQYIQVENPFEDYILEQGQQKGFDYSLFSTVDESRYSSLMPWQLYDVQTAFYNEVPNLNSFVDLTAHIGVDTVNLHRLYPQAESISIEIDPQTYLILRDNLIKYSIILNKDPNQVRAYNEDSSWILYHPMITDKEMAYIDPPWGGPEYIKQGKIQIFVGNLNSSQVVYQLLENGIPLVVLKAPKNINMEDFLNLSIDGQNITFNRYDIHKPNGDVSYILLFFRLT